MQPLYLKNCGVSYIGKEVDKDGVPKQSGSVDELKESAASLLESGEYSGEQKLLL